jgi:hypothetical protein
MLLDLKIRLYSEAVSRALFAISALLAGAFVTSSAAAQTGEPIKIGYSIALTGGLAQRCSPKKSGRRIPMPKAGCSAVR